MAWVRGALLGMVMLAPAAQAQAPAPWPPECKLSLAATLPIAPGRPDIVVPVQVNGMAQQFKLSTNSLVSSISAATVAALNLKTFGLHNKRVRDMGGADARSYAQVDSLVLGRLKADNQRLLVTTATPRVDGAIGPELLRRYDVEIDGQNGAVNLFAPHPCADRVVYWTDKYQVIPADITREGYVRIGVRIDGKLLHADLATGNVNSIVSQFAIDSLGLTPSAPARFVHGVEGGVMETAPTTFHSLQIGDIVIDSPTLLAADDRSRNRTDSTEMSLGMDILRRYHIYIAYAQRKVYLSPAEPAAH